VLGAFVVLARLLVPERRSLLQRVLFSHAPPADPERLREYAAFFRCPVSFDQPISALLLPAGVITAHMRHGDALLKDVLERHAQDLLRRRERRTTLADAVRQLVEATILDGAPARARVAAQLGVSARSLHRKLEALGTGYRQILDEVRLALAQERLRDSLDPLDAIAERVGFRSQQAFLRWFRERAGTTPGAYRRGAARARA
jgi:AraC-like DNA-binding protein